MNLINETLPNLFKVSGELQEVKKVLENPEVPVSSKVESIETLNEIFSSLEEMKKQAALADGSAMKEFVAIDQMENEAIELYGKAHGFVFDYKVSLIVQEAKELSSTLETSDMEKIARKVDSLRSVISNFKDNYRPSLHHRKIVDLAEQMVKRASDIVDGKKSYSPAEHQKFLAFLEIMLSTLAQHEDIFVDASEFETIMELFEISELFYKGSKKEGKNRLLQIIQLLPAEKREKLLSIEDCDLLALLVLEMAHELSHTKMPATSKEQLADLFEDAKKAKEEEEETICRIIPFQG